jgi:hypothetical protein
MQHVYAVLAGYEPTAYREDCTTDLALPDYGDTGAPVPTCYDVVGPVEGGTYEAHFESVSRGRSEIGTWEVHLSRAHTPDELGTADAQWSWESIWGMYGGHRDDAWSLSWQGHAWDAWADEGAFDASASDWGSDDGTWGYTLGWDDDACTWAVQGGTDTGYHDWWSIAVDQNDLAVTESASESERYCARMDGAALGEVDADTWELVSDGGCAGHAETVCPVNDQGRGCAGGMFLFVPTFLAMAGARRGTRAP